MSEALVHAGLKIRARPPVWKSCRPAWMPRGMPSTLDILYQFPYAWVGRQNDIDATFFKPKTIELAQRMQAKRAVRS